MPKEYKIETINDMMKIPLDRFGVFVKELSEMLFVARSACAYNEAIGSKESTIGPSWVWVDDGKGEILMNITWKKKGESVKIFYLLKNGEITEGETPAYTHEDWDMIPREIEGVRVLAIATERDAIESVRRAVFADEESLIGIGKVREELTPVESGNCSV